MDGSAHMEGRGPAPIEDINIELEQMVLGALLVNNDAMLVVRDILSTDSFAEPVHAEIYEIICTKVDKGETANAVTLQAFFKDHPALAEVGGPSYLVSLMGGAALTISLKGYAVTLRDLATRRQIHAASSSILALLAGARVNPDATADLILDEVEQIVADIRTKTVRDDDERDFAQICDDTLAYMKAAQAGEIKGVPTGIEELDNLIGSMQAGQFIVLGGRPKMGKTMVAANIVRGAAERGHTVGVVSLEMSAEQFTARMMTDMAALQVHRSIPYSRATRGHVSATEMQTLELATSHLKKLPITITDRPGMTVSQLRYWIRREQRKMTRAGTPLCAVMIDYLSLLRPGNRYQGNKVNEVAEISRELKLIAKEAKLPILCLAQLNRSVESREDKRPVMSDLRDSGAIEQDADLIMFCYREAYYLEQAKKAAGNKYSSTADVDEAELADLEGKIEIIVAAQRMGPTGTALLNVDLATGSIRSRKYDSTYAQGDILDGQN